ncbi:MAG: efflux RND transporter periplasmic adaptor subunit [Ignavibacteriaceae bacterium]|nr:efflux RND transporter periplasmic adaptor subunit [Ignavibacteriaceae bacterium]
MKTEDADLSSLKIDRSENYNSGGNKKIVKVISWLAVIVIVVLAFVWGWNKIFNPSIEVKLTRTSLVSASQSNAVLTASGYVVAQRKASIGSKATGRLVSLAVVEGDAVKKNQVIGRLEDDEVKALYEQTNATLKLYQADLLNAENNYRIKKSLFESKVASETDFITAKSQYDRVLASIELAKAQIKAAEVAVEYTLIRAPFDGTVLTKNADVGEIVSPLGASVTSRAAVVTIADMYSLQVETDVSESNIEKIKPKQNCEITLDAYPGVRYAGYVEKVVPTADRSKATVLVKVAFNKYDSRVLPEMSAKVLFLDDGEKQPELDEKPMLVVPVSAVVIRDSKKFVFKVIDDAAIQTEITTGKIAGEYLEVLSGLSEGEKVIEEVTDKIKDGVKVKVL